MRVYADDRFRQQRLNHGRHYRYEDEDTSPVTEDDISFFFEDGDISRSATTYSDEADRKVVRRGSLKHNQPGPRRTEYVNKTGIYREHRRAQSYTFKPSYGRRYLNEAVTIMPVITYRRG